MSKKVELKLCTLALPAKCARLQIYEKAKEIPFAVALECESCPHKDIKTLIICDSGIVI